MTTNEAMFRGRAILAALSLIMLAAAPFGSAHAQQGFESDPWKNALQILGFGDDEPKPEIDYRERAPLVLPPTTPDSLPAPQASAHAANPNWPKDPDLARHQREVEAAKRPVVRDDPGRPLMPSELNKGRRKTAATFDDKEPARTGTTRDEVMPSELGFKGWLGSGSGTGGEKPLTFNGEPTRESLVQPPPGYQTPAPNAPYGVVEKKQETFKFPTLFDMQK